MALEVCGVMGPYIEGEWWLLDLVFSDTGLVSGSPLVESGRTWVNYLSK